MASQHLILRTACSGINSGGGADRVPAAPPQADDPDQQAQEKEPSTSSSAPRPSTQQQQRHQRAGRAPSAGTSVTDAAAIQQRLESLPIWCDVTVLSEVASVAGGANRSENSNAPRTSPQGSSDDGT